MKKYISEKLDEYLDILGDEPATGLYKLFIQEAEKSLIECVLDKNDNNQSKSAKALGINRATLRSKIKQYEI